MAPVNKNGIRCCYERKSVANWRWSSASYSRRSTTPVWPGAITIGIPQRECLQSYKAAYDAITLVPSIPSDVNSDSARLDRFKLRRGDY